MKSVVLAVALAFAAAPAFAEEVAGKWTGLVHEAGKTEGRLIFITFTKDGDRLKGYLESPTQTPLHIPLEAIVSDGKALDFTSNAMDGVYKGAWDDTRKVWAGEWRQHGKVLVMDLEREKPQ
jgi:hypothetical protein